MEYFAEILRSLPDHPLTIVALAMVIGGGLAYFLFRTEKQPLYRTFALVVVLIGLGLAVLAAISYVPQTVPATPSEPSSPESAPPPVAVSCSDFDLSPANNIVVSHTLWCGGPGATRTIHQQARFDPTPSCIAHSQQTYAALTQNQLFQEAVIYAKQEKNDLAMTMIDACQCHNPTDQALLSARRAEVLCALRLQ